MRRATGLLVSKSGRRARQCVSTNTRYNGFRNQLRNRRYASNSGQLPPQAKEFLEATKKKTRLSSFHLIEYLSGFGLGTLFTWLYFKDARKALERVAKEKAQTNMTSIQSVEEQKSLGSTSLLNIEPKDVYRIVFTGGKSTGKTTSTNAVKQYFTSKGYNVYILPNVTTLMQNTGVQKAKDSTATDIEASTIKLQAMVEDSITEVAMKSGKPSIIICDQGLADMSEGVPLDAWYELLDSNKWREGQLRERYTGVIHFTSTAESIRDIKLDQSIQMAWAAHLNRAQVAYKDAINEKTSLVCRTIEAFIQVRKNEDKKSAERLAQQPHPADTSVQNAKPIVVISHPTPIVEAPPMSLPRPDDLPSVSVAKQQHEQQQQK